MNIGTSSVGVKKLTSIGIVDCTDSVEFWVAGIANFMNVTEEKPD